MAVRAVLFDLDETLIVEERSNEEAFRTTCALAARHGIIADELTAAVRAVARELWLAAPTADYCRAIGISSWEGLWGPLHGECDELRELAQFAPSYRIKSWTAALARFGVEDEALARELAAAFVDNRSRLHTVFDETMATLERLSKSHRLAIVTNGAPEIQRLKIERASLAGYFRAIVISGDIGAGKPDARIFTAALERIGVAPAEAVMVGDNIRRDVAGAQEIGMKGVWINRDGRTRRAESPNPDAEIRTLAELPEVLARLNDS